MSLCTKFGETVSIFEKSSRHLKKNENCKMYSILVSVLFNILLIIMY